LTYHDKHGQVKPQLFEDFCETVSAILPGVFIKKCNSKRGLPGFNRVPRSPLKKRSFAKKLWGYCAVYNRTQIKLSLFRKAGFPFKELM
jgi:hypothetical protein